MAHHIIRDLISDVRSHRFYAIIVDEYTDIANNEQLTFCLRWVDKELSAHEDFIGFYKIPDISALTIFSVIKDIILRLQLSWEDCRGQCYDGASNMLGAKSGVGKRVQEMQPKAHITHCQAHSLNLGVKDMASKCKLLSDTMNTSREIVKLIKYSPKRQNLLGEIKSNVEEAAEDISPVLGILPLCPTRWAVRANCFHRILENYSALLQEWDICLDTNLSSEVRARILGCKAQMTDFNFFLGLHLSHLLFAHTDNLSKTLQHEKLSAATGHHIASLVKKTIASIRNDESFDDFYETVLHKKEVHPSVSEPTLPRRKRAPVRFEIGSGEPSFASSAKDEFRRIYFEAIDLLLSAIDQRFNTQNFHAYIQLESLLLKCLNSKDYDDELAYITATYGDDIDVSVLSSQMSIFKLFMENVECICFEDILRHIQKLSESEKSLISEIVVICKLLQINPATSSTGERSFSTARRLKTWLRSTMSQQRFNSLAVLNTHKLRTDNLCLHRVANDFVSNSSRRRTRFGVFSDVHFNRLK